MAGMRNVIAIVLLLCACGLSAEAAKIVLVAGSPSHGHGEHEFNAGTLLLDQCLKQNKGVETVVVKGGWPEDESVFDGAAGIMLYMDGGARHPILTGSRLQTLAKLMQNGVGL